MQATLDTNAQGRAGSAGTVAANLAGGTPSELFTTLLVAQIRNQNPLEPTDPAEFVGQLTQLSQMETLQNLLGFSSTQASMLESLQVLGLGAQVGAEITVRSERVSLADTPVKGSFTLESGASRVTLRLDDGAGQSHRIELGTRPPGEVGFVIDPARLGIPAGSYTVSVETDGAERPAVEIAGELQSVRLSPNGGVALTVANLGEVASSSVTGFNGRRSNPSS